MWDELLGLFTLESQAGMAFPDTEFQKILESAFKSEQKEASYCEANETHQLRTWAACVGSASGENCDGI